MNEFNDEKIKKILKDNIDQPQIKLTANEIIARYEVQKTPKVKAKSFFSFPTVKVGLSFIMTALVIGIFVYLNRDEVVPPISEDTSGVTSSDPITSIIDRESAKIPGGKEGEFVFMSFSATSFTTSDDLSLTLMNYKKDSENNHNNSSADTNELEGVLDQTLPLVDDFYAIDLGFDYQKETGTYVGEFDTYTTKYILNPTTYILANIDFEEDEEETETELDGEINIDGSSYRYSGKAEVDLGDNETDISLKIEYSETSFLEIKSENEGQKQEFKYKFVNAASEVFGLKIETFRHGNNNMRYVETEVQVDGKEYKFIIGKETNSYQINYMHLMIHAIKDENGHYIYSY